MKPLLIIQFAKWPVAGQVKTRLAANLGNEAAKQIHIELMNAVFLNISAFAFADVQLWFDQYHGDSSGSLGAVGRQLCNAELTYRIQCQGDLGTRMANAFQRSLLHYKKVIIVGSDCPTVDPGYLHQASALLENHDVVLGPAEDGGYVLIGLNRFESGLFADVQWGGAEVLRKTQSNIEALGLSSGLLDTTWDVDELADYQRWQAC